MLQVDCPILLSNSKYSSKIKLVSVTGKLVSELLALYMMLQPLNKNASENIACEIAAIFSRGEWVNHHSYGLAVNSLVQNQIW